jgi:Zeta toxin
MTSRKLTNFKSVETFLKDELKLELDDSYSKIVPKIASTELSLQSFDTNNITLKSDLYRSSDYRNDDTRRDLRITIIEELISRIRLDNDDHITLGNGGAMPRPETSAEKDKIEYFINRENKAFLIIGLPASGKSTVSNKIADKEGAIILDSDYAKRKLPEFNSLSFGATLVHEEASDIIFGSKNNINKDSLFDYCVEQGMNVVIPKIGSKLSSIKDLIKTLNNLNYEVHLKLVKADKDKACKRALKRFVESKRYVPLSLIYDDYGNLPTGNYEQLELEPKSGIKSFEIFDHNN